MGYARTALLLAALTGLFLAIGWLIAGKTGLIIALGAAGAMNLFAYWNSDQLVLSTYGAREVAPQSAPRLYGIVARLAQNAGLPMPRVYVIDNPQPNAFATGRNPENAAVAATTGLLDLLSDEELAGVMAHELAHVRHRDTLVMTVTATIAGAIGMLANFAFLFGGSPSSSEDNRAQPLGPVAGLLLAILAPIAAMVVQMAISRSREYEADRLGAEICGRPLWLASALLKLQRGSERIDNPAAEAHPATAHLFIVNPLHGQGLRGLFTTHPAIEERVARLERLSLERGEVRPWG